jgi:hypothetical protein
MPFATRPLDASTWDDFARLAEDHHGVWAGCWCLGFHEEGRPHIHTPEQRRALKEARVRDGRAHAALAFDGAQCVGWCQFGSTEELPRIKHQKAYRDGLEKLPDWRITCFFVGRTHRHRGVANVALAGALAEIARLGGGVVEAIPRTPQTARCRARSSTTGPWRCSSATGSRAAAGSASTGSSSVESSTESPPLSLSGA